MIFWSLISVRQCLSGSWTSCCEKSTGKLHSYSPVWGGRQRQKNSPPPQDCVWSWWRTRLPAAARLPKSPTPRLRAFTAETCKRCAELFHVRDFGISVGVFLYLWSGDRSVVRAPDSWLKVHGFESPQEWWENFLLRGQLSVLTLISVSIPPPCYCSSM